MTPRERLLAIEEQVKELLLLFPAVSDGTRVSTSQALLDALALGGRIKLAPGDYRGNFVFSKPTELICETPDVNLFAGDVYKPTVQVVGSRVLIGGLTIHSGRDDREAVLVGSGTEVDGSKQPDQVTFHNTVLMATPTGGKRGFALHAREVTLIDCEARGFTRSGQDSQAVWINNGPGPYKIYGGYYEASGENILLGGDALPFGGNPSAHIMGAILRKPLEWRGKGYTIKNLFEVKAGVDVWLQSCTLDGCWTAAQAGSPIVLTAVDQTGKSPWTQVDKVIIQDNLVYNCPDGFGVNIHGGNSWSPNQPMRDIRIIGNLFRDSRGGVQIGDASELSLAVGFNSFPGITSKFLSFYGPAIQHLDFVKNVTRSGAYGITGDDGAEVGIRALEASALSQIFEQNIIEQSAARTIKYPTGNSILPYGQLAALLSSDGYLKDGSAGASPITGQ